MDVYFVYLFVCTSVFGVACLFVFVVVVFLWLFKVVGLLCDCVCRFVVLLRCCVVLLFSCSIDCLLIK